MDAALDRLRRDLLNTPPVSPEPEDVSTQADEPDLIDYASVEFEVERMRKRLAVWEIFMAYMRDGARSWPQVQQAITPEDFDKIIDHLRRRPVARPAARPAIEDCSNGGPGPIPPTLDRAATAALGDGQACRENRMTGA